MTFSIPTRQETGIHVLSSGLSMEWIYDGRILQFEWTSISREIIDEFARVSHEIMPQWPTDEAYLQISDLRFKGFAITPYLRAKLQTIMDMAVEHHIHGRIANVLIPDLGMRTVQFLIRTTVHDKQTQAAIFADYDKAITWLEESKLPADFHEQE